MKKGITLVIVLFLLAVGFSLKVAQTKLSAQTPGANTGCIVPKTFGTYRGTIVHAEIHYQVIFEDAAGTVRIIDFASCESRGFPWAYSEIKRQ